MSGRSGELDVARQVNPVSTSDTGPPITTTVRGKHNELTVASRLASRSDIPPSGSFRSQG
jgi:hypothetical protein